MAKEKISVEDETIQKTRLQNYCAYVKTTPIKVVGVWSDPQDMLMANKSKLLKKLKNRFKFTVQIVIK